MNKEDILQTHFLSKGIMFRNPLRICYSLPTIYREYKYSKHLVNKRSRLIKKYKLKKLLINNFIVWSVVGITGISALILGLILAGIEYYYTNNNSPLTGIGIAIIVIYGVLISHILITECFPIDSNDINYKKRKRV